MARINIASFFSVAHNIASFFCAVTKFVIDVASFITRTPYFAILLDFCDRALWPPTPPADPETDRWRDPITPTLRCIKKGECKTLCEKRLHPSILHRFLMARRNIASFFNGAP
jgi:hypothetical protein